VEAAAGKDMDFTEFLAWSLRLSRDRDDLRRLCETRIARAFEAIQPKVEVPARFAAVHRCDLARQWCAVRELPAHVAKTTLICEGVRHGLALIMRRLAEAGKRVALPKDVYPVYWGIVAESGVDTVSVETFPRFDLEAILESATRTGCSLVLLTAPLKLQSRNWTAGEAGCAVGWLEEDPQRRLILDGVYSCGLCIDEPVKRLIETNQVIYLDSLSKGWLHERILGAAIVPDSDREIYAESFRGLAPDQNKLFCANELLTRYRGFPIGLNAELDRRRASLWNLIATTRLTALPAVRGYLIPIECSATRLIEEHGLLTLPATVFGSSHQAWSVASALPAGESP
jgi:hypothetical protein